MTKNKIVYALDNQQMFSIDDINKLSKYIAYYKIGYQSIASNTLMNQLYVCSNFNLPVILDIKLHDTPNTVFNFIKSIA